MTKRKTTFHAVTTPDEVREARKALGMTQAELADALELEGNYGKDSVRNWERGKRSISGPCRVAIRLMLERMESGGREYKPKAEEKPGRSIFEPIIAGKGGAK
jgi:DNA-binding transcriptional regulator YiaG